MWNEAAEITIYFDERDHQRGKKGDKTDGQSKHCCQIVSNYGLKT